LVIVVFGKRIPEEVGPVIFRSRDR
jgi:hypothetical protein